MTNNVRPLPLRWPEDLDKYERPTARAYVMHVREILETGSTPLHVISSDGHRYFVKAQHNPHHQSSLLAEVVVHGAAQYLGVPTPEYSFLDLPVNLAESHTNHHGAPLHPGICFASREIDNVHQKDHLTYLTRDNNPDHGPGYVALWEWCMGEDSQFLYRLEDRHSLTAFDYGLWLGMESYLDEDFYLHTPGPEYRWPENVRAMSARAFIQRADSLTALTQSNVLDIVSQVPVEWGFPDSLLIAIARWLYSRRRMVATSLLRHANNAAKE